MGDANPTRCPPVVIPGRRTAASPETIFQRPVSMGSGPGPSGHPGMKPLGTATRRPGSVLSGHDVASRHHQILAAPEIAAVELVMPDERGDRVPAGGVHPVHCLLVAGDHPRAPGSPRHW